MEIYTMEELKRVFDYLEYLNAFIGIPTLQTAHNKMMFDQSSYTKNMIY